jgi:hypothetical protein
MTGASIDDDGHDRVRISGINTGVAPPGLAGRRPLAAKQSSIQFDGIAKIRDW